MILRFFKHHPETYLHHQFQKKFCFQLSFHKFPRKSEQSSAKKIQNSQVSASSAIKQQKSTSAYTFKKIENAKQIRTEKNKGFIREPKVNRLQKQNVTIKEERKTEQKSSLLQKWALNPNSKFHAILEGLFKDFSVRPHDENNLCKIMGSLYDLGQQFGRGVYVNKSDKPFSGYILAATIRSHMDEIGWDKIPSKQIYKFYKYYSPCHSEDFPSILIKLIYLGLINSNQFIYSDKLFCILDGFHSKFMLNGNEERILHLVLSLTLQYLDNYPEKTKIILLGKLFQLNFPRKFYIYNNKESEIYTAIIFELSGKSLEVIAPLFQFQLNSNSPLISVEFQKILAKIFFELKSYDFKNAAELKRIESLFEYVYKISKNLGVRLKNVTNADNFYRCFQRSWNVCNQQKMQLYLQEFINNRFIPYNKFSIVSTIIKHSTYPLSPALLLQSSKRDVKVRSSIVLKAKQSYIKNEDFSFLSHHSAVLFEYCLTVKIQNKLWKATYTKYNLLDQYFYQKESMKCDQIISKIYFTEETVHNLIILFTKLQQGSDLMLFLLFYSELYFSKFKKEYFFAKDSKIITYFQKNQIPYLPQSYYYYLFLNYFKFQDVSKVNLNQSQDINQDIFDDILTIFIEKNVTPQFNILPNQNLIYVCRKMFLKNVVYQKKIYKKVFQIMAFFTNYFKQNMKKICQKNVYYYYFGYTFEIFERYEQIEAIFLDEPEYLTNFLKSLLNHTETSFDTTEQFHNLIVKLLDLSISNEKNKYSIKEKSIIFGEVILGKIFNYAIRLKIINKENITKYFHLIPQKQINPPLLKYIEVIHIEAIEKSKSSVQSFKVVESLGLKEFFMKHKVLSNTLMLAVLGSKSMPKQYIGDRQDEIFQLINEAGFEMLFLRLQFYNLANSFVNQKILSQMLERLVSLDLYLQKFNTIALLKNLQGYEAHHCNITKTHTHSEIRKKMSALLIKILSSHLKDFDCFTIGHHLELMKVVLEYKNNPQILATSFQSYMTKLFNSWINCGYKKPDCNQLYHLLIKADYNFTKYEISQCLFSIKSVSPATIPSSFEIFLHLEDMLPENQRVESLLKLAHSYHQIQLAFPIFLIKRYLSKNYSSVYSNLQIWKKDYASSFKRMFFNEPLYKAYSLLFQIARFNECHLERMLFDESLLDVGSNKPLETTVIDEAFFRNFIRSTDKKANIVLKIRNNLFICPSLDYVSSSSFQENTLSKLFKSVNNDYNFVIIDIHYRSLQQMYDKIANKTNLIDKFNSSNKVYSSTTPQTKETFSEDRQRVNKHFSKTIIMIEKQNRQYILDKKKSIHK